MNKNTSVLPISLGMVHSYLLKGTKCVLVDAGYPGCEKRILSFLAKNRIDPKNISLILITHGHSDHFGSVEKLRELTGAKVAIHKLDADALRNGKNPPLQTRDFTGNLLSKFLKEETPGFRGFEPDIIIEQELSLQDFGVNAKAIYTPGHTMGSVSVAVSTGEIIVGDLIIGGLIRNKKPQYSWFGDVEQMRNSTRTVMQLSPRIIYSGHGGPFLPSIINKHIRY